MELHEIEELMKSVNRGAIRAFLRNAALLKNPNTPPNIREMAEANLKAIAQTNSAANLNRPARQPRQRKKKAVPTEQAAEAVAPVGSSAESSAPVVPAPYDTMSDEDIHDEFARHHAVDPVKFKEAWGLMSPQQRQMTRAWHADQMAARQQAAQSPAPTAVYRPTEQAVAPTAPAKSIPTPVTPTPGTGSTVAGTGSSQFKMGKSIDALYDLFSQLKKNL